MRKPRFGLYLALLAASCDGDAVDATQIREDAPNGTRDSGVGGARPSAPGDPPGSGSLDQPGGGGYGGPTGSSPGMGGAGVGGNDPSEGSSSSGGRGVGGAELGSAGKPSMAAPSNAELLTAFESTLLPVTRTSCGECHSSASLGVWPLIADVDAEVALEVSYSLVSLNTPQVSRLVQVVEVEEHQCSLTCLGTARDLTEGIAAWAELAPTELRERSIAPYVEGLDEATVLELIAADRATLGEAERVRARYVSLHQLNNAVDWGSLDDPSAALDRINAARVAVSLVLNSSARHAPRLAAPVAIDAAAQILRIDIADYFGFDAEGNADPSLAAATWARIAEGNVDTDDELALVAPTYPNNAGFRADYVDADQLVYTLTRPDVYNDVLQIPATATELERELGVAWELTPGNAQFLVVSQAVTGGSRLVGRAASRDGAYWRTTDQMVEAPFIFYERPIPEFVDPDEPSQLITTALSANGTVDELYSGATGPQANYGFVLFDLPNGLLGFALFGPTNERLDGVLAKTLADPWRWHEAPAVESGLLPHTLVGESCFNCHQFGLRGALDFIHLRLGEIVEGEQLTLAQGLYPGADVMTAQFWEDAVRFWSARTSLVNAGSAGMAKPSATENGVLFLIRSARERLGYPDTPGN